MRISVVIPTLQAEELLPGLLKCLKQQTLPPDEIIVVDSSSSDATARIARDSGCTVEVIARSDFRHGRTRNLGARLASGEILVFMTQDALPANDAYIIELTAPIREGRAAAAMARQLPDVRANPIEAMSRGFNYPGASHLRTVQDIEPMGVKAFFFSDAASAVAGSAFAEVGIKFLAFRLGRAHRWMPIALKKILSGHPDYWLQPADPISAQGVNGSD